MKIPAPLQQAALRLLNDKFMQKAQKMLGKKGRILSLLALAQSTYGKAGAKKGIEDFQATLRMIRDYATGRYTQLPWRAAVSILGALLYLVSPIDVIPDFIPFLGWLDDVFILGKMFEFASKDVQTYRRWEVENQASPPVVVR